MRGDVYIWSDGERVHFWSADGHDWWQEAGWAEGRTLPGSPEAEAESAIVAGGVSLRQVDTDAYVLMRLAELVAEGRAVEAIDRALERSGGNFGAIALGLYAERLRDALHSMPTTDLRGDGAGA